jgi:hypothetical protein
MSLILSGTNGLSDVDGSAATPAIRGTDTNTGIFFPAADTIAFAEGGVEAMRLDSAGNLGLGVTPSAWNSVYRSMQLGITGAISGRTDTTLLELAANAYRNSGGSFIYLTTDLAARYDIAAGVHRWYNAASGTAGNAITFTQAMTLDASGNLGLTSGKFFAFDTAPSSSNYALYGTSTQTVMNVGSGGVLQFNINNTERARIDSSGNLLVGQTSISNSSTGMWFSPNYSSVTGNGTLFIGNSYSTNSGAGINLYSTGASAYRFYVGMAGTVFATSTTISAISDIRFKENVRDLNVGIAEVMALKPRLYDWKEGKGADIKNARGFIAQEFEEVFPDLIDEWRDPAPEGEEPYKSVRADLIPVLVKAIQEQQAIITQLQADVQALKGQA